ncbi:hypothetical protein FJV76_03525 [Mesorhizobium sp. WSM4303]|uniref:hypothetical protein n=1 Tax=unclassified Mesorhizobium TaxID=325217 RepID=UPI00115E3B18|nr:MULTISPECIES: hypothetical protein [unclassified Mesorhizobium]TRD08596.1 hypothetical protein FJV76_03525 [Mesorhizobium sp. WSM4303]
MQHPGSTEWPIWHDNPGRDRQELGAPSRHDIALARYLETQQAHRASTARRLDPAAVVASALAAFVHRVFRAALRRIVRWPTDAVAGMDDIGLTLSKAHAEFSKTLWGR